MKNLNSMIALTLLSYILGTLCGFATFWIAFFEKEFPGFEEVVFATFLFILTMLLETVKTCRYCFILFLSVFLFSYLGGVPLFWVDWEEVLASQPLSASLSDLSFLALWAGSIILVFAIRKLTSVVQINRNKSHKG